MKGAEKNIINLRVLPPHFKHRAWLGEANDARNVKGFTRESEE